MALNGMTRSIIRLAGVVTAISVIVGSIVAVQAYADNRYVQRHELIAVQTSILDFRRGRLEDEIFKLELIPLDKRTTSDNALLEHYKLRLIGVPDPRPAGVR